MRGFLYIKGKPFGEFRITRRSPGHAYLAPHWFCPVCGTEWALVIPDLPLRHQFFASKCPDCGGGTLVLWGNFPLEDLDSLALAREIDLLLTHKENYHAIRY